MITVILTYPLQDLYETIHVSTHKWDLFFKSQCSPGSIRLSALLCFTLLITCLSSAYIYNPEINRELDGVSLRRAFRIHEHRISQSNVSSLGPPYMGTVLKALCSALGDKKSRGWFWQLQASDSSLLLQLCPFKWNELTCYFFPFLCPEGMTFTHLRTRFPNLFPHHSAKFELPDHPGCMEKADIK